ncbi:unnamed protein product [Notodromas monacha]|uniref:N-acetyltransferase domain-containing protein n=1 Tax=Notodromas monacha TaxID=399045 RepID=A0A7R9GEH3_9CRUS|nr:unnamed protein product [Notodromas monacha]CAG0918277.1 unnamed protein product [Notodromas monacha]
MVSNRVEPLQVKFQIRTSKKSNVERLLRIKKSSTKKKFIKEKMGQVPRVIDGIEYDIATDDDAQEIAELFISDFCLTEPLNKALKVTQFEARTPVEFGVRKVIKDGISVKATDISSKKIVAGRLSMIVDSAKKGEDAVALREIFQVVPERLHPLINFVTQVASAEMPDIFQKFGVDKYVEFMAVNVNVDYRGKRIAQNILNVAYDVCRSKEFHVVKVLATNPRTAHIFQKQGFEKVASYKVLDYIHDGKSYFEGIEELEIAKTFLRDLRTAQ